MECPKCHSDKTRKSLNSNGWICSDCGHAFAYYRLVTDSELEAAIDRQLSEPWRFGDR